MLLLNPPIVFSLLSLLNLSHIKDGIWQKDSTAQQVTFYSQKEAGSNEWLARKGVLVIKKDAPATVLLLHGFGTDKSDIGPFRLLFKNYNSMVFDFRAHGESKQDQSCTFGHDEVYDVFAAVDFLKTHPQLKDKPIFAYGLSMGAATAIESQSLDPSLFQAMALDAPFMSSEEVVKQSVEKLKFSLLGYEFNLPGKHFLEKYAFNPYVQPVLKWALGMLASMDSGRIEMFVKPILPIESIKKVTIPVFFIVCRNDEKVSKNSVENIFKNHPGISQFWVTDGRRHCDSVFHDPECYAEMINKFFDKVLSGKIKDQTPKTVLQKGC